MRPDWEVTNFGKRGFAVRHIDLPEECVPYKTKAPTKEHGTPQTELGWTHQPYKTNQVKYSKR